MGELHTVVSGPLSADKSDASLLYEIRRGQISIVLDMYFSCVGGEAKVQYRKCRRGFAVSEGRRRTLLSAVVMP
jgi:hypothetical protein